MYVFETELNCGGKNYSKLLNATFTMFWDTQRQKYATTHQKTPKICKNGSRNEPVGICWNLLKPVGACWALLKHVGICWNLPEPAGICWNLLAPVGTCWDLLELAGAC